ncbi:hypothetical protein [Sorangium sp. So ce693]
MREWRKGWRNGGDPSRGAESVVNVVVVVVVNVVVVVVVNDRSLT